MRGHLTDPDAPGGLRFVDDLPEPSPAPDELVLDVHAYAINPGEAHLIRQRPHGWRPGQDVSGVVVRAAGDGSGPVKGARIAAIVNGEGWSERVPVPTRWAAEIPDGVPFEQAAALPIAGLTALRGLRYGGFLLGRDLLVTGATGGVGHMAVQLGVAAGAHVTALVSSPERVAEAQALGAHRVVTSLAETEVGMFDHVLDGVGGPILQQAVRRLTSGGLVALYGASGGPAELALFDFLSSAVEARIVGFTSSAPEETKGDDLAILAGLVGDGRLVPTLGLVGDWTETVAAFEALAARQVRGKAVLLRT